MLSPIIRQMISSHRQEYLPLIVSNVKVNHQNDRPFTGWIGQILRRKTSISRFVSRLFAAVESAITAMQVFELCSCEIYRMALHMGLQNKNQIWSGIGAEIRNGGIYCEPGLLETIWAGGRCVEVHRVPSCCIAVSRRREPSADDRMAMS